MRSLAADDVGIVNSQHTLDNAFEKQKTAVIAEFNVVALISDGWSNIRKEHLVDFIVSTPNLKNKPVFIKSISTGETQLTGDNVAKIIKEVIAVVVSIK